MDSNNKMIAGDQQQTETEALTFCWEDLIPNLMTSLQDLAAYKGVPPEVCLRLGDEETRIHGVLLAALSGWWRKHLDSLLQQDTLIFHNIMVDFRPTHGVLAATRALLYSGCVTISSSLLEQVQSVTRSLNLDSHELTYSVCSNNMYLVQWRGFREQLLQALQSMCRNQQCTDISIVVNGHIIKGHKLVLGASSPVFNSAFREDRRMRIIHLPDIKVKIAQHLITYMYYGRTCVLKNALVEFHKLCVAFQVESLKKVTKNYVAEVSAKNKKEPQSHVTIHARVRPEAKDLWGRLQQYYTVGRNADLMLVVENKRMLAHKTLFSAICPPIHEVLVQELSNEHALVMITNTNHSLWEGILNIMYRGSCTIVGNAISTVFSYIDLSLFDIEVNEIPTITRWQKEHENIGKQIFPQENICINTNPSMSESSSKTECGERNLKKRKLRKLIESTDDTSASDQNQRVTRLRTTLANQKCILKMDIDLNSVNNAASIDNKEILRPVQEDTVPHATKESLQSSLSSQTPVLNQSFKAEVKDGMKETSGYSNLSNEDALDENMVPPPLQNQTVKDAMQQVCQECNMTFKTKYRLLLHQHSHGIKVKAYNCDQCNISYYHRQSLKLHYQKNHGLEAFNLCSGCGKIFSTSDTLNTHQLTCPEEPSQQSPLSITKATPRESCSNSILVENPLSPLTAPSRKELNSTEEIAKGKNIHDGWEKNLEDSSEKYFCPDCGKGFTDLSCLGAHADMFNHALVEESCWICGLCNAAYLKEDELTSHMKSHEAFPLENLMSPTFPS